MNTFFTFFTFSLLLSLLNDIFEFNCEGIIMALTCNTSKVPNSTELIFVKAISLPEHFMIVTWSIVSFFCVAPSAKLVATALILVAAATFYFFLHILCKPIEENSTTLSTDDAIEMSDIYSINHKYKKPSLGTGTFYKAAVKAEALCDSAYAVFSEDFSNEDIKSESSPYAIYLGRLFSETAESTVPVTFSCEIFLDDLFNEASKPLAPSGPRISYADAVGYEFMEVRKPRNPDVVGYEVFLGDLFFEEQPEPTPTSNLDSTQVQDIETEPIVQARRYSFATLKAQKAEKDLSIIFAASLSIDNLTFIQASLTQSQHNLNILLSFSNLFTISEERSIAASQSHINMAPISVHELFTSSRFNLKTFNFHEPVPSLRISYADAVGYSQVKVRTPKNPDTLSYDVYLGDLFSEPDLKLLDNEIPPDPVKISYADAVGYDRMELKYPRKSPLVCYEIYLGELFFESETIISQQKSSPFHDCVSKVIELIEFNYTYYITYALTKSIMNNQYFKLSHRNKQPFSRATRFIKSNHYNTMKNIYIY